MSEQQQFWETFERTHSCKIACVSLMEIERAPIMRASLHAKVVSLQLRQRQLSVSIRIDLASLEL